MVAAPGSVIPYYQKLPPLLCTQQEQTRLHALQIRERGYKPLNRFGSNSPLVFNNDTNVFKWEIPALRLPCVHNNTLDCSFCILNVITFVAKNEVSIEEIACERSSN